MFGFENGLLYRLKAGVGRSLRDDLRAEVTERTERADTGEIELVIGDVQRRHLPRRGSGGGGYDGAQRTADIVLVARFDPRIRVLRVLQINIAEPQRHLFQA